MELDKTKDLKFHAALEQETGGDSRPITGHGATSLYVYQFDKAPPGATAPKHPGVLGLAAKKLFNPYYRQKMTFFVDDAGQAHELDRHSLAIQRRLGRAMVEYGGMYASEMMNSKEASTGVTAVAAIGTVLASTGAHDPVSLMAGVGAMVKFAGNIKDGLGRVRDARNQAFDQTVEWAKGESAKTRSYPSFSDAWNFYTAKVDETRIGAPTGSKLEFFKKLRTAGL